MAGGVTPLPPPPPFPGPVTGLPSETAPTLPSRWHHVLIAGSSLSAASLGWASDSLFISHTVLFHKLFKRC